MENGHGYLLASQNSDGGWGGAKAVSSTIEETALATEALASPTKAEEKTTEDAILRGAQWLAERTHGGRDFPPSPIGLYFASLWYYEKLYPIIFTVSALGRILDYQADEKKPKDETTP